jgi:hypothetical protein
MCKRDEDAWEVSTHEIQNTPAQPSFNASLQVDFQGSRVTSDGGLIRVRELDERLGFGAKTQTLNGVSAPATTKGA